MIASIAYPNREKWEQNIAYPFFTGELDELTADDCGKRYALKSRFGRVFYYTDVYAIAFFGGVIYESVSENRMKDYHLRCLDIHVQKSDEGIYQRICDEINRKMPKIYRWWRKMSK